MLWAVILILVILWLLGLLGGIGGNPTFLLLGLPLGVLLVHLLSGRRAL